MSAGQRGRGLLGLHLFERLSEGFRVREAGRVSGSGFQTFSEGGLEGFIGE